MKITKDQQQKPTTDISAEKLSKSTMHGKGKLKDLSENLISIPRRMKIKRDKKEKVQQQVKNAASTKAAKSPQISSFFKQAHKDQDIIKKNKETFLKLQPVRQKMSQKNRRNYFYC